MKKRESFWNYKIKSFPLVVLILVSFTIIGMLILYGLNVKFNKDFFCQQNPDECVCEYTTTQGIKVIAKYELCNYDTEDYNLRKLTPQELLTKSCNDNPREDSECKCVRFNTIIKSYKTSVPKLVIDEIWCLNVNGTICIIGKNCYVNTTVMDNCIDVKSHYEYNWDTSSETTCTSSTPKPKPIEINLKEEKCVEHTDDTQYIIPNWWVGDLQKGHQKNCLEASIDLKDSSFNEYYDQYCCTKKEKLTPCEKGDPDFVGEFKCEDMQLEDNITVGEHSFDCDNPKLITCRKRTPCEKGDEGFIEDKQFQEGTVINVGNDTFLTFTQKCIDGLSNKFNECYETTCRPKTEVEKEQDKWKLNSDITRQRSITIRSHEVIEFNRLEEYDISYTMPNRYKMKISDVKIINVKEPYNCILYCPNKDTLFGCEYGTCYKNHSLSCIEVKKEYNRFESHCDNNVIIDIEYRYKRWRKT